MPGKAGDVWKDILSQPADDSRQAPTVSDNASEPPTSADDSRLIRTTVRLAAWQRRQLEEAARVDGRLLSDVVREAVRDYLRNRN